MENLVLRGGSLRFFRLLPRELGIQTQFLFLLGVKETVTSLASVLPPTPIIGQISWSFSPGARLGPPRQPLLLGTRTWGYPTGA